MISRIRNAVQRVTGRNRNAGSSRRTRTSGT
jgi:hypothetical protein